jgi:DNA mismatch endonuclease (patch repair protein)
MDNLPPDRRSANMRRIRSAGMKPEMTVRKMARALGYRYRLHRKDLPGKPDLVFARRGKVIFVHGCFWHQHQECREGRSPGSNTAYWLPKLARNVERDAQSVRCLKAAGWDVLVVWECETNVESDLRQRLLDFLALESGCSLSVSRRSRRQL